MPSSELIPLMPARNGGSPARLSGTRRPPLPGGGAVTRRVNGHLRAWWSCRRWWESPWEIHNGKEFQKVDIQPEAVFHYLGEFALTRRKVATGRPASGPPGRASTYRRSEDMERLDMQFRCRGRVCPGQAHEVDIFPKHAIEIARSSAD